jgi:hypothetical protein
MELLLKHRSEQHALGAGTAVLEHEAEHAANVVEDSLELIEPFEWEETTDQNVALSNRQKDEVIDPLVQEKLEREFEVYTEHKLKLIDQGIDLLPIVKRRPPTQKEKKDAFIKNRDKFLKRMSRSEDHSWGTDRYERLLEKWFPDYTLVLENKVSEIKNTVNDSIEDFNQKISAVIEALKKGLILKAEGNISAALKLINDVEKELIEATKSKDNAVLTLTGFPEDKTRDFLPKYDAVLDLYRELITTLQANIGGNESDTTRFEATTTQLSQQKTLLDEFNFKIQNTFDVLELVRLQDTEFTYLITSTEKIIEEANKLEPATSAPDEMAVQNQLDTNKTSIAELDKELVTITKGVSSVYWDKGVYYNEKVDALYIVAKDYPSARNYSLKVKHTSFWFFVDQETGWTSQIQMKDGFKMYYSMNPISLDDYNELAVWLNYHLKKTTYSSENLHELFQHEVQEFRMLVEKVQFKLYGTSTVTGFGLLTQPTRKKIKHSNELLIPAKTKFKAPEKMEMKFTTFQKAGIAGDPGKDPKDKKNSGVNLRSEPDTNSDNILQWLPFGTKVHIQSTCEELGWYYVITESGEKGYVSQALINIDLPDPDARLYVVKKGDTALELARKFYSKSGKESLGQVQEIGEDFRNYVDKLARYNKNTSGVYYNGGKNWADVHLLAGFMIWIPSPMTMYEMIRATPNSELHGASSYISIAQDVFDYAPQNLLIHELLKLWRSIPAEELNKGLQAVDDVSLFILKSMRVNNMEWLDAIIALVSPAAYASVKALAFMREFTIGYIEHMRSLDAQTRVKSMERFLYSHTQLDYYKGIFEGIGEGIIDWFKDLWGMFKGVYDLIVELPKYIAQIQEAFGDAANMVIDLVRFLNDPSSAGSLDDLIKNFDPMDIFKWIDAGIEKAGKKAGAWAAEKVIGFMNLTPIEAGRKIGWLIGYLIPEVILAVFSFGIGTAVKAGAQVFARAMDFIFRILGKTMKLIINAIKIVVSALDDVIEFVKSITQFFKRAGKKMSGFFDKLEEFFQKFKEYLKRKEKSPDADDLIPNDKDKLPEKHEKKSSDVDESKESDKLDESSLGDKEIDGLATSGDELLTLGKKNIFKGSEEMLKAAKKKIADYRIAMKGKKKLGGNLGYVEGEINGIKLDDGLVSSVTEDLNAPKIFDAKYVNKSNEIKPSKVDGAWLRTGDSEFKMITEKIAQKFNLEKGKIYTQYTGTVKIVSELPYCGSCSGVIHQLSDMLPNVNFIIINGTI